VKAIDILAKYYPDEDHILVYDNATTHQKQADGALSAHYMPLNTSKPDGNWLVDINAVDGNGKQIYTPDGKFLKTKVQMEDATFADGTKQPLYFPPGHLKEGLFKGMKVILEEQGITLPARKKNANAQVSDVPTKVEQIAVTVGFSIISQILPWWKACLKLTANLVELRSFSC
jgi:hypothetical protein